MRFLEAIPLFRDSVILLIRRKAMHVLCTYVNIQSPTHMGGPASNADRDKGASQFAHPTGFKHVMGMGPSLLKKWPRWTSHSTFTLRLHRN